MAMPFLVYLIIGILECPTELALRVRRTTDKTNAMAQEPIAVRIVVENQGKTLVNLHLDDPIPHSMMISGGQPEQRLTLLAGATTELRYASKAARGLYTWNTVRASASDAFGLFELKHEIPCLTEIGVRPAPLRLRHISIRPRATLHAPGLTPARPAGPGTDFWGVREYKAGDSLRRLNWRLASRYPRRLYTNEYEGEEIADFGLIVDARRLANAQEIEEALFESTISAAASLSEVFLKSGNRVALLIFGETTTCLFPGYGKGQLNLVLRDLARARLGRNVSSRYLEYFPARVFPSRSVILVFSALDARDVGTYSRLRAFGYEVLLISPDPIDCASRILPPTEINGLALRAARLERMLQLKGLMKMGVGVIDWQIERPLDTILQSTARYMAHRRAL